MPVNFQVTVEQERSFTDIAQRTFNDWVRIALMVAARWWVIEARPRHFGPQASARYAYHARSAPWKAAKLGLGPLSKITGSSPAETLRKRHNAARSMARRGQLPGMGVPARDPKPFDALGDLKAAVLGRSVDEYLANTKATATAARQTVRVPVRLPHPVNHYNAGELTKVLLDESLMMHKVASEALRKLMRGDLSPLAQIGEGGRRALQPKRIRKVIKAA